MPSRTRCFLLVPTAHISVSLRRYKAGDPKCTWKGPRYPGGDEVSWEVHNIEIEIGREMGTVELTLDGDNTQRTIGSDDLRWPTRCRCGYEFPTDAAKQECRTRLYRRVDTDELMTLSDAPAGALYDSGSFNDIEGYQRNGRGVSLVCKTPGGEWHIDGPATNGPGWTRTGEPPNITVNPSIAIGQPQRYHAMLINGWLESDFP